MPKYFLSLDIWFLPQKHICRQSIQNQSEIACFFKHSGDKDLYDSQAILVSSQQIMNSDDIQKWWKTLLFGPFALTKLENVLFNDFVVLFRICKSLLCD